MKSALCAMLPAMRATVFVALLGAPAIVAAQAPAGHPHRFSDAPRWAKSFDDPARDAWQKPQEVIAALALANDAVVADIGAGTGYFALRLAQALPQGRIYGVDTEPDMVAYLAARAQKAGVNNLVARLARADAPDLPVPADLVLMVNVYHHVAERIRYFSRLRDSLKPGGRVAIIDFNNQSPVGPPVRERVGAGQVLSEMGAAGYRLLHQPGFLPNQYFLIFESAGR